MSFEIVVNALGWTLLHSLWQGAIIGLLFVLSRSVLQTANPTVRHGNALAWLVLFLVLPVLTLAGLLIAGPGTTTISTVPAIIPAMPVSAWSDGSSDLLPYSLRLLGCLWLAGVLTLLVRLWRDWRQLDRFTCAGVQPLPQLDDALADLRNAMKVRTRVALYEAGNATVPMVVGFLKPMIVVPSSVLLGLTPRELELIVAHELAHLRRKDHLINYLLICAETLFFYHPVVYSLSRTIRHERELCCDDLVIKTFNERVCYAHALSKLEMLRGVDVVPVNTLRLAAADGPLVVRIARLVQQRTHRRWGLMPAVLLPFVAAGCVAAVFHQAHLASRGTASVDVIRSAAADSPTALIQVSNTGGSDTNEFGLQPVLLPDYQRRYVAATTVSRITSALTQGPVQQPLAAIERGIQRVVDSGKALAGATYQSPGERGSSTQAAKSTGSLAVTGAGSSLEFGPQTKNRAVTAGVQPAGRNVLNGESNGPVGTFSSGSNAQASGIADSSRIAYDMSEFTNVYSPAARESGLPTLPSHLIPSDSTGKSAAQEKHVERINSDSLTGGSLIHSVTPRYPNRARSRGFVDKVVVSIEVDATGSVNQVLVVNNDSRAMFQRAVVRAVSQWKFEPLLRNGQPVEQTLEQSFDFRLQPYTAKKRSAPCEEADGDNCPLSG